MPHERKSLCSTKLNKNLYGGGGYFVKNGFWLALRVRQRAYGRKYFISLILFDILGTGTLKSY